MPIFLAQWAFAVPGIVHRIDRDTTGSLLVCKTDLAHRAIAEQLKEHSINRRYRAIVHGVLKEDEGTINAPIGRHPTDRKKMAINEKNGKEAITHYRVLERFRQYTYIECVLETGRTHQIRVHMSSIHHPLLGDEVYGPAKCHIPFRVRRFMRRFLDLCIQLRESIWNLARRFRNISRNC